MHEVDIITNIPSHYRKRLWIDLLKQKKYQVNFLYGTESKSSIKQMDFNDLEWTGMHTRFHNLVNVKFFGVLIWQIGVLARAINTRSTVSIFLGDMYVVSTWLAVLLLKLRRRKIIFWGHGLYGNEAGLKKIIRLIFLRLADVNLLYGDYAKKLLIREGFSESTLRVIYNSLDYPKQKYLLPKALDSRFWLRSQFFGCNDLPVLVFIGRLTRHKKIELLIDAVKELNHPHERFNLLIVGDGPSLYDLATRAGFDDRSIFFYGSCYDEMRLAELIGNADLCVSPGEVGLTAIHALGYGTPVCTHNCSPRQMPEHEAVLDGVNGMLFDWERCNICEAVSAWFGSVSNREDVREACVSVIEERYSPDNQIRLITEAVDFVVEK